MSCRPTLYIGIYNSVSPVDGLLHSEAEGEELVLVANGRDMLSHITTLGPDPRDNFLIALQERDGKL